MRKMARTWLGCTRSFLRVASRDVPEQLAAKLAAEPSPQFAAARALLAYENECGREPDSAARAALSEAALRTTTQEVVRYHALRRLVDEGHAASAAAWLQPGRIELGERARISLELDALAALGREDERLALGLAVIKVPRRALIVELLGGHLVRYPNAKLFAAWTERLADEAGVPVGELYPQQLAQIVVAGTQHDNPALNTALAQVRRTAGDDVASLRLVEAYFSADVPPAAPGAVLPLMQPMPLEIAYALYARYDALRSGSASVR
jgi:hypothetical protein